MCSEIPGGSSPEITPAFVSVSKIIDSGSNWFCVLAPSAPNSSVSDGAAVLDDPELAVDESVELAELELLQFAPFELAEENAT